MSSSRRSALRSLLITAALLSCSGDRVFSPALDPNRGPQLTHVPGLPAVRVSEFHYDNVGTDAGEFFEISAPAGTSLSGWKLVLYNGNPTSTTVGRRPYTTTNLAGTIPATCGTRGVVVISYPTNGIQNGGSGTATSDPDGWALVDATNHVVEFLSYEGVFTAITGTAGGPAAGMTTVDIGVRQLGSEAVGSSLQRNADGVWTVFNGSNTSGACNDADVTPPPPPPPATPPVVINELMSDPWQAAGGASWGEWFEVHNNGAEAVDLEGWTIASSGQTTHTINASVIVPAGGFAVLGRGNDVTLNGGVTLNYNYFTGSSTIFLDATDWLALRDASGATVDSVRWTTSSTMVRGVARGVRDASADNADVAGSNWGYSATTFGDGDFGTPGAANGTLTTTAPAVPPRITFSGRTSSDPALPVGFEDQLFATLTTVTNQVIETTFSWTSETPSIASVDARGVVRALAAGTLRVRATATDGSKRTYSLPTRVAVASTTASYVGNTEFGVPSDGSISDDFIVTRAQYTASWNPNRGTPNWVSFNLEATHFGSEDRCDCFTYDPQVPGPSYTTADYTGAGTFHGYGIDRGHLARSFDRTAASLDNATTFYFTNIIPQAADNNQGPWAALESHLGNLAAFNNKEIYVITGASGSKGTVKNEGRITIPTHTWKVAVIMPRNQGLSNIDSHDDFELLAVVMPNDAGIRNVDWETYKTTVNAVEALSGYDVLALLPDHIEAAIESGVSNVLSVVDGLIASNALNRGNATSLRSKLDAAAASLEAGNVTAGVNQLEAFLHEVDAMARSRRLSDAEAASLRSAANAVIQSVSN